MYCFVGIHILNICYGESGNGTLLLKPHCDWIENVGTASELEGWKNSLGRLNSELKPFKPYNAYLATPYCKRCGKDSFCMLCLGVKWLLLALGRKNLTLAAQV